MAIADNAVRAAEELRQANEERKARGAWARLKRAAMMLLWRPPAWTGLTPRQGPISG